MQINGVLICSCGPWNSARADHGDATWAQLGPRIRPVESTVDKIIVGGRSREIDRVDTSVKNAASKLTATWVRSSGAGGAPSRHSQRPWRASRLHL